MNTTACIIIMLVCLIGSAFFSATETAFSTMNRTRIRAMSEDGNSRAALALSLSGNYDKLISTLLIGNNIVNIALASLGTVVFVHIYGDTGASISTAVCTVIVLVFGEVSPKSMAKDSPESFAILAAPLVKVLIWFFTPVNWLFTQWKKLLSKLFKSRQEQKMSQAELLMFVDEVQADGSIDQSEGELLRSAIEFTDIRAIDILTHRVDIEAVSLDADNSEIARIFSESKFSRLLVYDRSIDNIVGVIHQKDFYIGTGITSKALADIMTPPIAVPKSCKISQLLKMLQKNKSHVAVILDEYGGTLGIVTMEDILEELVGDIWDEHDEIVEAFHKIKENSYIVDANIDFDDFARFFGIECDNREAYTVSAWVSMLFDTLPKQGDQTVYEDLQIKVLSTQFHRINQIEVKRLDASPRDVNS